MMSKITDELKKYKEAATSEAKETRLLVKILMSAAKDYKKDKKFKLDDEDIQFIKDQSQDLLKLIPLIVIQILPGSTIATPFIVELSKKLGIKLNSKIPEKHKEKKSNGEIEELVNSDGSMIGKSTPMLDLGMHPRKTMDQTIMATRQTNNPVVRGYRVYYGESEENKPVIDEEDITGAFGGEETKNAKNYDEASEIIDDLGIEDPIERNKRVKQFGFEKYLDKQLKIEKKNGKCKNCFVKKRLTELENEKMVKMIDEILIGKKSNSNDVIKKTKEEDDEDKSPISKILMRNIESIKKIAEKEGISLNKLLKHFRQSE
jgi:hypothetical protein